MRQLMVLAAVVLGATTVSAQQTPVAVDLSPRGQVEMTVFARGANNRNAPMGKVHIDYGQPSARGRAVAGGLIPSGQVWRLGANAATSLVTDVDLTIGGTRIPKGSYTMYSIATASGAQLIINKQTAQWGTTYDQAQDLARIPLTVTSLHQPVETFTIWLIPGAAADGPKGELRMAWGTVQYSTTFSAQ
jgi:hypothetical protein